MALVAGGAVFSPGPIYADPRAPGNYPPGFAGPPYEGHIPDDFVTAATVIRVAKPAPPANVIGGANLDSDRLSWGQDFFERMHVLPREFELGNVLATQTIPVEVLNAFRRAPQQWTGFTTAAGDGTSLLNQPSYPATIANMGSITNPTLEVTTVGPPTVDSTLDFTFGVLSTLIIPITLRRVVLFGIVPPELPYQETLSFLTEIHRSKNQTERRVSLRQDPRSLYSFRYGVEEGRERTRMENTLFGRQGQAFGIPIYHEAALLSSAVAAGATTLPVDSTAFADFRVNGFVVVYQDGDTFDVVQATAIAADSFTVDPPLTNAYAAGIRVAPLRLADTPALSSVVRHRRGLSFFDVQFRVIDNRADIASAAAFGSYDGSVLLDDPNFVVSGNTVAEQWSRPLIVLDNETGRVFQTALGAVSRHLGVKTFWAGGRQAIWELRQLLFALRGRQISFFLPSFSDDLQVEVDPIFNSTDLVVQNTGYTQDVASRSPRSVIRMTFNDGSPALLREIASSSVIDSAQERLVVDTAWPSNIAISTIARVEFVEKVRFDEDEIEIEYQIGGARAARVSVPVASVLE